MTLWARRSLFREQFDMNTWELSVTETDDSVVFCIALIGEEKFDLDNFKFKNMIDTITGVGQDSAEFIVGPNITEFRIEVPERALPDDYMD